MDLQNSICHSNIQDYLDWFQAVENCDTETMKKLIEQGVDVNVTRETVHDWLVKNQTDGGGFSTDPNRRTMSALSYAAQHGEEDMLKLLLQNRAKPILPGQKSTPLALAVAGQHMPCVTMLLPYGNPPSGNNPISLAAHYGYAKLLRMLISVDVPVHCGVREHKAVLRDAVYRACQNDHKECIDILMEKNTDIDSHIQFLDPHFGMKLFKCKLLCVAIGRGNALITDSLYQHMLKKGQRSYATYPKMDMTSCALKPEPESEDREHHPVFETIYQSLPTVDQIETCFRISLNSSVLPGRPMPVLHNVAFHGLPYLVNTLISIGVDVNQRVERNKMFLSNLKKVLLVDFTVHGKGLLPICYMLANTESSYGLLESQIECVKLLLKSGHILGAKADEDNALILAYFRGYLRLVLILLEAGTDYSIIAQNAILPPFAMFKIPSSFLKYLKSKPRSLKVLTRIEIRKHIPRPILYNSRYLPLPKKLIGFVNLDELDTI